MILLCFHPGNRSTFHSTSIRKSGWRTLSRLTRTIFLEKFFKVPRIGALKIAGPPFPLGWILDSRLLSRLPLASTSARSSGARNRTPAAVLSADWRSPSCFLSVDWSISASEAAGRAGGCSRAGAARENAEPSWSICGAHALKGGQSSVWGQGCSFELIYAFKP